MTNSVRVDIVCPCGRLLDTRMNNPESRSKTNGTRRCSSCKKEVSYQIVGANAYTSYR